MKTRGVVLLLLASLIWSDDSSAGNPLKDWKNSLKKATGQAPVQPERTPVAPPTKADEPVDKFEYESALTVDDRRCTQIVDPFSPSRNLESLSEQAVTAEADKAIAHLLHEKPQHDKDALETAKIHAKRQNWLSMDRERAYGRKLHERRVSEDPTVIARTNKGRSAELYSQADALLAKVLMALSEKHPYTFELILIDNGDINAAALPGGYIYLNTGVLTSDHAELVISHEISHVLKRHETRVAQAQLIDRVETLADLTSLVQADSHSIDQLIDTSVAHFNLRRAYSRQQELQADACAVRIASRIPNLPIEAMIDRYVGSIAKSTEPVGEDRANAGRPFASGSTHPAYPERRDRMREVWQQLAASTSTVE